MVEDLGLVTCRLPALPRFRRHAGAAARQGVLARRAQVRRHAGARLRLPDGLQQCLARQPWRHRPGCGRLPRARRAGGKARHAGRPSRRWPGGATSTTTAMPGRWSAAPITRRSVSSSIPSTSSRAGRTWRRSAPSRRTGSSSSRWRTRRSSTWIICPGAATTAASRGRAICRSTPSWTPCRRPASTACSRSRSSTTASAPAPPAASRSTGSARCSFMLDQLQRRTGVPVPGLPELPPRAACHGVEFVEFAMDERSAERFRARSDGARLRQGRQASLEGRHPLASGRHQHRREQRQGGLRPFLQHHPWALGLRHRVAGR